MINTRINESDTFKLTIKVTVQYLHSYRASSDAYAHKMDKNHPFWR